MATNSAIASTAAYDGAGVVAEVLGLYGRVRWLLRRHGEVETLAILRRTTGEHTAAEPDGLRVLRALLLGRAVMRVLGLLPTDSRCLMRSLVLAGLLARRGVSATVVIGVRPAPSFAAHAWVEVEGRPVLPTDESVYQRLVEL